MVASSNKAIHISTSAGFISCFNSIFMAVISIIFIYVSAGFSYRLIIGNPISNNSLLPIIFFLAIGILCGISALNEFVSRNDYLTISETGIDINVHREYFWQTPIKRQLAWSDICATHIEQKWTGGRFSKLLDYLVVEPKREKETYSFCLRWMETDRKTLCDFIGTYHKKPRIYKR